MDAYARQESRSDRTPRTGRHRTSPWAGESLDGRRRRPPASSANRHEQQSPLTGIDLVTDDQEVPARIQTTRTPQHPAPTQRPTMRSAPSGLAREQGLGPSQARPSRARHAHRHAGRAGHPDGHRPSEATSNARHQMTHSAGHHRQRAYRTDPPAVAGPKRKRAPAYRRSLNHESYRSGSSPTTTLREPAFA